MRYGPVVTNGFHSQLHEIYAKWKFMRPLLVLYIWMCVCVCALLLSLSAALYACCLFPVWFMWGRNGSHWSSAVTREKYFIRLPSHFLYLIRTSCWYSLGYFCSDLSLLQMWTTKQSPFRSKEAHYFYTDVRVWNICGVGSWYLKWAAVMFARYWEYLVLDWLECQCIITLWY